MQRNAIEPETGFKVEFFIRNKKETDSRPISTRHYAKRYYNFPLVTTAAGQYETRAIAPEKPAARMKYGQKI